MRQPSAGQLLRKETLRTSIRINSRAKKKVPAQPLINPEQVSFPAIIYQTQFNETFYQGY
jgi:hypothetical protein